MKRSPHLLLLGLLTAALLAPAAATTPALAGTTGRPRHHVAAVRRSERRGSHHSSKRAKGCHSRAQCGDNGGTPASAPKTPHVSKHRQASPKSDAKPVDPAGSTPASRHTPSEQTAAVIAGVLATPCADTELTPSAEDIPLVRASVLCLINRIRAEHGLIPLAVNARLESAAEGHCAELISADYFAHVAPDGETPVDRIRKTGYIPGPSVGYVIGENLAWGTYTLSTPQSIVAAWVASPGHLANILESQYRETGIGIVPSVPVSMGGGSPGASYAQEFGVIIH